MRRIGAELIDRMSDEFEPDKYRDEYRICVLALLTKRAKGCEITVTAPAAPRHGQVIDLLQALKQSMERARQKKKPATLQKKKSQLHRVKEIRTRLERRKIFPG